MDSFGLTDRGKVRKNNQDNILVNREHNLFIVADGMGGHAHGEVASEMAINTVNCHIQEYFTACRKESYENDIVITALLKESFRLAHEAIFDYSQKLLGQIMGTTLALLLFRKNKAYLGHIGDSRIYRLRKGYLEKLTKDHTEIQDMVDAGLISEEDAENHRLSHVLTRALGVGDKNTPDIHILDVEAGDRYLITSDGIFRVMNLPEVQEVLASSNPSEEKCSMLLENALQKGSPDNVSVIVMEL